MIRLLTRLIGLGIIGLGLFIVLGPGLIKGVGNALISSLNNSTAYGLAQIVPATQGKGSVLHIKLDGLAANTTYDVTLNEDSCGGAVFHNFGKVKSDKNGSILYDFSLADLSTAIQKNLWLVVHKGNNASGPSVACGSVQINDTLLAQLNGATPTSAVSTGTPAIDLSPNPASAPTSVANDPLAQSNRPPGKSSHGFPNTGVASGGSNSYDNYTFPRKY